MGMTKCPHSQHNVGSKLLPSEAGHPSKRPMASRFWGHKCGPPCWGTGTALTCPQNCIRVDTGKGCHQSGAPGLCRVTSTTFRLAVLAEPLGLLYGCPHLSTGLTT